MQSLRQLLFTKGSLTNHVAFVHEKKHWYHKIKGLHASTLPILVLSMNSINEGIPCTFTFARAKPAWTSKKLFDASSKCHTLGEKKVQTNYLF